MRWVEEDNWTPPTPKLLELASLYAEEEDNGLYAALPTILSKVGPFQIVPNEVDADSIERGKELELPGPVYYYHD